MLKICFEDFVLVTPSFTTQLGMVSFRFHFLFFRRCRSRTSIHVSHALSSLRFVTGEVQTARRPEVTTRKCTSFTASTSYRSFTCLRLPAFFNQIPFVIADWAVAPMSANETITRRFRKPTYVRGLKMNYAVATNRCDMRLLFISRTRSLYI